LNYEVEKNSITVSSSCNIKNFLSPSSSSPLSSLSIGSNSSIELSSYSSSPKITRSYPKPKLTEISTLSLVSRLNLEFIDWDEIKEFENDYSMTGCFCSNGEEIYNTEIVNEFVDAIMYNVLQNTFKEKVYTYCYYCC
jgi:hypothetical protein